jgi:hypothetical protein
MPVVTNTPLHQSHVIPAIAQVSALYNRMRWFRSRTGQAGPYAPATATTVQPAILTGTVAPYQLTGRILELRVNGTTDVTVDFTSLEEGVGGFPWGSEAGSTAEQAAAIINETTEDLVASVDPATGWLSLTTVATGTGASVEIVGGDAAPYCGFYVGDAAVGLGVDLVISSNVQDYLFLDQNSHPTFWYRVEYYSTTSAAQSLPSTGVPSTPPGSVPLANTIACYLRLCRADGTPAVGRTIALYYVATPGSVIADGAAWNVTSSYDAYTTDAEGYVHMRLIRGITVLVSIPGTGMVRRVTLPATGLSVNLFDPAIAAADEFSIVDFQADFAIRVS